MTRALLVIITLSIATGSMLYHRTATRTARAAHVEHLKGDLVRLAVFIQKPDRSPAGPPLNRSEFTERWQAVITDFRLYPELLQGPAAQLVTNIEQTLDATDHFFVRYEVNPI